MKRARKILLAAGGVLILSYPGLAWITGIAIEGRIQHNEQQALDEAPYVVLLKRDYHRGVYRSTEVATYSLRNPALQAVVKSATGGDLLPAATFTVVSNIQHGPLPGLRTAALGIVESTLIAPPALQEELADLIGSQPVLRIRTRIGLFGGANVDLTSPRFSVRLPDGSNLTWGGLTGAVTITGSQDRWSGELSAPRLAFAGARGRIELAGLEYSGSRAKAFDGIYLGTGTFTVERLEGSNPRSGGNYSLQRIAVTSTSQAAGKFVDVRIDAAADAAQIAAVTLKNLSCSVSFEHLYGPSLASMGQAIRALQHQPGTNRMQIQAGVLAAFRQYGGEMLLRDPVMDIRQIGFTMPEGSFVLSARLGAAGLARADLQWPAVLMALRSHAQVTADLRIENGLMQKLLAMGGSNPTMAARLASLEQQGYLTAASTAVTTHLEYSGGRLALNGHPFPPAAPTN